MYAGVDYGQILKRAEAEADVILWDGGNNDLPFYVPDLHICIADPHRPGHETAYHPGEANFRRADVILINKCDTADEGNIHAIETAAAKLNPRARVLRTNSPVVCERPELVRGKRVLVVEDGPTLTHGGMTLRSRPRRGEEGRRRRDRRPAALRRRHDRGDLPEVPERGGHPPRDGLRRRAGGRARRDDCADSV